MSLGKKRFILCQSQYSFKLLKNQSCVTFQLCEAGTSASFFHEKRGEAHVVQLWAREGTGHLAPVKTHSSYLLVANP